MSVAASSPHLLGAKRIFEGNEDQPEPCSAYAAQKRFRHGLSPGGRCSPLAERQANNSVVSSTLSAVRALFPDMDEQVIGKVLEENGDDIDAAIRRLNDLRINMQQQQQQADSNVPVPIQPWVDTVLQQLGSAKDMDHARQTATQLLTSLVATAVNTTHAHKNGTMPTNGQDSSAEVGKLRQQVADLSRENHILKRAVNIQAQRMQDAQTKDAELASLRQVVSQCQEKIHSLEVTNYSLAMHLKQATDGTAALQAHGQRHPDVF